MNDEVSLVDKPSDKIGLKWILLFLAVSFGVAWGGWIACGMIAADPQATQAARNGAKLMPLALRKRWA